MSETKSEDTQAGRDHAVVKPWMVQVKGTRCGKSWEISVVRKDNKHGQISWGWFDENKLLVSHNGGPCKWPICQFVWERQIKTANELCDLMNSEASV